MTHACGSCPQSSSLEQGLRLGEQHPLCSQYLLRALLVDFGIPRSWGEAETLRAEDQGRCSEAQMCWTAPLSAHQALQCHPEPPCPSSSLAHAPGLGKGIRSFMESQG